MTTLHTIITHLENLAPLHYQESYDNCGLITGNKTWQCTGALTTLDCTEAVLDEAIALGCNLVVAHHPIVFKGLKNKWQHLYRACTYKSHTTQHSYICHTYQLRPRNRRCKHCYCY
jgi:putative NIF3 family GTP cyclohydrolase 1 type 2